MTSTPLRFAPAQADTFTRVVLERAAAHPERAAFIYLPDRSDGTDPEQLTYGDLDVQARRVAAWLQERRATGRPVLLLHPPGPAFLTAFAGCLYAGAVAVPAPLPTDQGEQLARVGGILRDSEAVAVLTTSTYAPLLQAWLDSLELPHVHTLATDAGALMHAPDPEQWRPTSVRPDDLAFLQYTSGSTSDPKGVMVTHANLLANEAAIHRWAGTGEHMVVGGWLPHYHDLGLIGHLLQPLYAGGVSVQMSPLSFLKRPRRWLEMIGTYQVEGSGAPDFAFELCTRRITDEQLEQLDLSSWRVAPNGAEPVRAETLRAFAERFAPAGFRAEAFTPCYGLAETTLLVTGADAARRPTVVTVDSAALEQGVLAEGTDRTLVSSGTVRDCEVRISDPETGGELGDGQVGEVWVRGPSVTAGYYGNKAATAECFRPDGWVRTGDLGVLDGGELYVTGRIKEVVVLAGRNLYPHDVERAARSADPSLARGAGAAFGVTAGDREHLVLILEVRLAAVPDGDLHKVATAVQHTLGREFALPVGSVLLVRPGAVRRTTSGKVRRRAMRELFLQGEVTPLYEVLDPAVRAIREESS
ncbi:fatty acyl-AMP ligase [Streptomyces sp. GESEQ-35]|uniref:fatty acyl-AMP ligase n=1 Tax=Streptomyces sp. GESEQ-35 TaxID=2812657 RepID=UPI001B344B7A|nr:fatty acyl-AMP ligase [Streptomyces sp. GESEQ-35]